jgi:hypothetical protein
MYTMLLLDVSGSITESGSADSLVDAATLFTDRVGKSQKVGVYAFDGEKEIRRWCRSPRRRARRGGLEGLRTYKPKDPSTNLHGAVIEGLKELKKQLDKEKKPLKFGTLVVFSDGTDRAARFSRDEMKDELNKDEYADYEMYAIGVGAEIKKAGLGDIGRDGTELATDQAEVKTAFERVADRIERTPSASTCSATAPPRARASTRSASSPTARTPRARARSSGTSTPTASARRRTATRTRRRRSRCGPTASRWTAATAVAAAGRA